MLDGEPLSYEIREDGSISFTLPTKTISAGSMDNERVLTLHIPDSFVSTGELVVSYEKVTIQQSPNGFKQEFEESELTDLTCSIRIGWAASAKEENDHKDLMAYLTGDGKGIFFQHENNSTSSDMLDFTASAPPTWTAYKDKITSIQLIDGMTSIGDYAFKDFEKVSGISLPQSIQTIGSYAFENTSLETLTVPASVVEVKEMSFGHIEELKSITFEHIQIDTLKMPDAGPQSGAFYVENHVDTTIQTENDDILYAYQWHDGYENRRGIPIMAAGDSWQRDLQDDQSPITDKSAVRTIELVDFYRPDGTEKASWDASDASAPGTVTAYLSEDGTTLTIAGNGYHKIIANEDSSKVFKDFEGVMAINGITQKDAEGNITFQWDTSNVTSFQETFSGCSNLKNLDVASLPTSKVKTMNSMFANCSSIPALDVSDWNTSQVEDFRSFAFLCPKLTTISLGENFATDASKLPSAGSGNGMFYVDTYTETTISGKSTAMQAYDWVTDNRDKNPEITVSYTANGGQFTNGSSVNNVKYNTTSGSVIPLLV